MPFITLDLWPGTAPETKKRWIQEVTSMTLSLLQIPPDKIQVLIRDTPKENWGKAGAVPTEMSFSHDSRVTDWNTKNSYYDNRPLTDNMAIVTIDVWNMYSQEQKSEWTKGLTELTTRLYEIQPDQFLILIRDMPPGNWGQTGVTGEKKNFLTDSRQL